MAGLSITTKLACAILLLVFAGSASTTEPAHAAQPRLALDGLGTITHTCLNYPFCIESQLLTTTKGHDIVALIFNCGGSNPCESSNISIIDGSGLTFTQRISYAQLFEYYAVATSPLKLDNITVVTADHVIFGMQVLAISGANARAIFDPDTSIPSTVSCWFLVNPDLVGYTNPCSTSIQTSTIDFVIAATEIADADSCGGFSYLPPPGFTNIAFNGRFEVDYSITTAPRSNVVFSCSGTEVIAIVVDAISFYGAFGLG